MKNNQEREQLCELSDIIQLEDCEDIKMVNPEVFKSVFITILCTIIFC